MPTHAWLVSLLLLCLAAPGRAHGTEDADAPFAPVQYGAMPTFNYTTDYGLTWGGYVQRFHYGDPRRFPYKDLWTLSATSATRGATHVGLEYEWLTFKEDEKLDWRFSLDGGYANNPFERYFGSGADTSRDKRLDAAGFYEYQRRIAYLHGSVRKPIQDDLHWRVSLSPLWENLREKQNPSQYSDDFGANPARNWRIRHSAALIWDTRNSEFSPDEGFLIQPAWTSSFFSWHRFDLDLRGHHPLIADRWLSLGAQLRLTDIAGRDEIPLNEKPRIGGWTSLRGLPPSRYVVDSALVFRGEVRSIVIRERLFGFPLKLGVAPFVDLGRGADHLANLSRTPTRVGYGISWIGSYFTDDFLGTLDMAWSQGQGTYYLTLGHAF